MLSNITRIFTILTHKHSPPTLLRITSSTFSSSRSILNPQTFISNHKTHCQSTNSQYENNDRSEYLNERSQQLSALIKRSIYNTSTLFRCDEATATIQIKRPETSETKSQASRRRKIDFRNGFREGTPYREDRRDQGLRFRSSKLIFYYKYRRYLRF